MLHSQAQAASRSQSPRSTNRRNARGWCVALLAIILATLAAGSAEAQVGLVPDPITTPELQPIIETIGLSDQQALTLLPIHDAYKERYQAFQNGDVQKLMDQLMEIGLRFTRGKFEIPPRKELEGIVSDFKRLLDKSRSLDRAFFVEVGGMLAEDQMPKLERARINRELKVFRDILGGVGEMNRGSGVNLAEMVRGLDLSPQEREQVDPVLNDYESQLLAKSNTIYSVLTDAAKVVLDFIDESGIRGMTMEQMMAMGQNPPVDLINKAQTTFDEASKPIQAAAFDVSQMNMRMFKRLTPLLSADNARDLRDRYFRRAYREIYQSDTLWEARYRAALRLEELTEEQRAAITQQRDSFIVQFDAVIDSGVAALEASREYKSFRQFSQQEPDPAGDKVLDASTRAKTVGESALATLNSLLGETLVAKLDEDIKNKPDVAADQRRVRMATRSRPAGGGNGAAAEVRVDVETGQLATTVQETTEAETEDMRYLPAPMAVGQFQQMLTIVGIEGDDRDVAMTIFDAYRTDYAQLRRDPLEITKEGSEPTPAETGKARATRQDQLAGLDQQLFDDLALLLHDDAGKQLAQAMRQTRLRSASTDVSRILAQSFGDDEAYIDLIALMTGANVPTDQRKAAVTALNDYDARIAGQVTQRLEAAREVQRRADSMQRSGRSRPAPGGNSESYNTAMQFAAEKWRTARQALTEINRKIEAVNREALDQIAATLPADMAWELRLAYNQAAYPDIFRDDRSAEKSLQGALQLPDLDDSQRERINAVATQYRSDFYAICEQMVGLRKQRDFDFLGGTVPQKDDIDREIDLEKLRFNRNELSARARLQLTLILSDDQAKAFPELQTR